MGKARIWRAFFMKKRIFSENRNAWLRRQDPNRNMVNFKREIPQP
jgi:hypothetical protein